MSSNVRTKSATAPPITCAGRSSAQRIAGGYLRSAQRLTDCVTRTTGESVTAQARAVEGEASRRIEAAKAAQDPRERLEVVFGGGFRALLRGWLAC